MWLESLGQTEDKEGWNERSKGLCGCELMGVERCLRSVSHRPFREASIEHQAWEAKRRAKHEPCLQEACRAGGWVHVVVVGGWGALLA